MHGSHLSKERISGVIRSVVECIRLDSSFWQCVLVTCRETPNHTDYWTRFKREIASLPSFSEKYLARRILNM